MVSIPGNGKLIIDIAQTVLTNTNSWNTANAWTDLTGFTVSITPKSSTNKIMITSSMNLSTATGYMALIRLVRGSTPICVGDTAGSRTMGTCRIKGDPDANHAYNGTSFCYIDSPATTSTVTYKLQFFLEGSTMYLNRAPNFADNTLAYNGGVTSSFTVQEITGY